MRDELRTLVDHISESDVPTARKLLRALVDPVELALLNALPDDEPLSEHERAATEDASRRERRGEPLIPHADVMRCQLSPRLEMGMSRNSSATS
jgi:hypothetical protein